ncbi:hypothetical protein [Sedimentibacter sp.]|nr:hypothetical protein [Sedimentibacter sp.]
MRSFTDVQDDREELRTFDSAQDDGEEMRFFGQALRMTIKG